MIEKTSDSSQKIDEQEAPPIGSDTGVHELLQPKTPEDVAAILDALTLADPKVKAAMTGDGQFISHDELMKRLGRT